MLFVLQVLDRMILYLRIVHSLDYYSASEYPNEDEMPHRCGIIHGRAPPPLKMTQNDGKLVLADVIFSQLTAQHLVFQLIRRNTFTMNIDFVFSPVNIKMKSTFI